MPRPIHRAAALLLLGAALSPALGAPAARAASCSIDGFSTTPTQWYDARFDGLSSEAHAFFTISISNGEGAPYDVRNSANGVYIGALATHPTSVMYAVGGPDELVQGTNALRFALFCSTGTRIQPITIRYDSVAPDVTAPAAPAFLRGTFEASATASDATSGIEDVRFALAGGSAVAGSAAAAGPHSATLDTAGLLDGPAVLTAIAHDQAGNARSASRTVTIDNGAPSGALAPLATQHASGVLELGASAADAVSGVERVAFELRRASAGAWQDAGSDTSAPYAADLDTAARQDGEYELRVVVRDRAGNETASAPSPVTFDNTAPSGSINGLPAAARGVLALSADAADAGSGLASAAFEHRAAGDAGWQSHAGESFALDTRLHADGLYDLRLVLVDRAGNRAVTAARSYRIDNTPPTAALALDPAWSGVPRGADVDAQDAGSGVARIEAGLDGAAPAPVSAHFAVGVHGVHEVAVRAVDEAGNVSAVQRATARVDLQPPTLVSGLRADSAARSLAIDLADADAGIAGVTLRLAGADLPTALMPAGAGRVTAVATAPAGLPFAGATVHVVARDAALPANVLDTRSLVDGGFTVPPAPAEPAAPPTTPAPAQPAPALPAPTAPPAPAATTLAGSWGALQGGSVRRVRGGDRVPVSGTLAGPAGPVAGGLVTLTFESGAHPGLRRRWTATADARGRFAFPQVRAGASGDLVLAFEGAPGIAPARAIAATLRVAPRLSASFAPRGGHRCGTARCHRAVLVRGRVATAFGPPARVVLQALLDGRWRELGAPFAARPNAHFALRRTVPDLPARTRYRLAVVSSPAYARAASGAAVAR